MENKAMFNQELSAAIDLSSDRWIQYLPMTYHKTADNDEVVLLGMGATQVRVDVSADSIPAMMADIAKAMMG